ncbi:hypothetical protein LTR64_006258 [Lithohypha guttulata]|uniref:uncharacterized protein n=1 Tax=Lithohypha guttulata TaxID=1690604 RepID=UPI002DDE506E|nr:hypothetical protein LTR51_001944 [Lithohypha guttulata]
MFSPQQNLRNNHWQDRMTRPQREAYVLPSMSSGDLEGEATRRQHTQPYGGKHPIPTIRGYREHRKQLEDQYGETQDIQEDSQDDNKAQRAYDSAKTILKGEDEGTQDHNPYPAVNRNDERRPHPEPRQDDAEADQNEGKKGKPQEKSNTEKAAGMISPKDKRKAFKHKSKRTGGREVTDPVTHLPIVIHDQTEQDLEYAPENVPPPGSNPRSATGLSGASKDRSQLNEEQHELQRKHNGLQKSFPPPAFRDLEKELASIYKLALTAGLSAVLGLALVTVIVSGVFRPTASQRSHFALLFVLLLLSAGVGGFIVYAVRGWLDQKVSGMWDDEVWDAARQEQRDSANSDSELPESVHWLNSWLSSVWPLINPDLFAALVDTLEDVMQASLPKVVRMVSVDDMGQGSEAIQILGIQWLPTGAASQSVNEKGQLMTPDENQSNDRTVPGQGEEDRSAEADEQDPGNKSDAMRDNENSDKKQKEQEQESMRAGMEAEEGDFVNMELAFAYRARSSGKSIASKAKNAHLYLKFYLPGGIAVPVWVELRGFMGIMRVRMQLTPDPPFFSVCTFTFLGQPKADLSCVPLSKHSLNLMDVPLISSFVQSAIDAALAEYVAPKSLTLDVKDMLMGEDYKKDTTSRGVVWIFIRQARDFKQGDGGIGPIQGASDAYVTVSWGKFGKPVASTRVIEDDQAPNWHEWASIMVSPDELNAGEKLRLQLWDSDKWTNDDDLGRVEVDLHDLMHNPETKGKMYDREDRFKGSDLEEDMPGSLSWSVGYFEKTRITQQQLQQQTYKKDIRSKEQLEKHVTRLSERKLREANLDPEHDDELHQQKVTDYKEIEDNMIISAPPSKDYLSGILSIQIHNITGLEVMKSQKGSRDGDDLEVEGDNDDTHLPDSYCTIALNHKKIYKTRTKPRNAKPFFNAGTERFVKDWTTCELIVSVRDSREKEDDALLGVVYLPLWKLFSKRSQIMDMFPLAGGIGYGRARISLVWRSVDLKLPPHLRGWDYGTLEIKGAIRSPGQLDESLKHDRIKLRTNLSKTKFGHHNGQWQSSSKDGDDSVFLAVRNRYSSPLTIEFRKSVIGPDKTPAFCVLWLSELTDDQEETKTLRVWKGGKKNLARAQACCDYQGLEDDNQGLGEVEITLKFWKGLSGYHKRHANKSQNADVRNVMECLDTINDEDLADQYSENSDSSDDGNSTETENGRSSRMSRPSDKDADPDEATKKKLRTHTNRTDSDDGSDLESSEEGGFSKIKAPVAKVQTGLSKMTDKVIGDHDINNNGHRGLRAQIQEFKQNHKQQHRKHGGIMQWKSVRTLDWAGGKAKRAKSKVGELFEHSEKGQGIETEV